MKNIFLFCVLITTFLYPQIKSNWTFTEMTGSSLLDHSGNGRHGQIVGATWQQTSG